MKDIVLTILILSFYLIIMALGSFLVLFSLDLFLSNDTYSIEKLGQMVINFSCGQFLIYKSTRPFVDLFQIIKGS